MKNLKKLGACCVMAAAFMHIQIANAWSAAGYVFCDANQNEQLDAGDTPLTGVFVVVTNTSGTFSNGTFTATPDGSFVMDLPAAPDSYVLYAHPLTLPSDAIAIMPAGGAYTFTLDGVTTNFLGSFLIASASCTNTPPPPPPPQTNSCCLKACGVICNGKKPQYVFGGQV